MDQIPEELQYLFRGTPANNGQGNIRMMEVTELHAPRRSAALAIVNADARRRTVSTDHPLRSAIAQAHATSW
jgi:hypothetical protein